MFNHRGPWPISMQTAIARTGLPIKKNKVFKFLKQIGAFDQYNQPDNELIENGYFFVDYERYNSRRSASIPRIASPEGFDWFNDLMKKNLSKVS